MQTISNSWKHSGFVLMVSIETNLFQGWVYSAAKKKMEQMLHK